jgi:hypothetical protein
MVVIYKSGEHLLLTFIINNRIALQQNEMSNVLLKEDVGLCHDIETKGDDILLIYGNKLDEALDSPINRMSFLFPNKKYPEKSVKDIQLRVMSVNLDIPDKMHIDDIIKLWEAKTGKNKLLLDISVNAIIDADFRLMTEMEVESDWQKIVRTKSEKLTSELQYKNGVHDLYEETKFELYPDPQDEDEIIIIE